jgi:hypothetical protein
MISPPVTTDQQAFSEPPTNASEWFGIVNGKAHDLIAA